MGWDLKWKQDNSRSIFVVQLGGIIMFELLASINQAALVLASLIALALTQTLIYKTGI